MESSARAAISLRGITKQFGPVLANDRIDLEIAAGTIHGIIGENGAGKSTLMSILYGFYQADAGEILVDGQPVRIRNSREAIAAGIGMVHQHFMLVDTFTVLENVVLGAEQGPLIGASLEHARKSLAELAEGFGLRVDPDALAGELAVGLRQRVEILKALFKGARILVLDEPTGVLTPQEADSLFDLLRQLKARGVTVVLITHKLREIMAITDEVSVMRGGRLVATRQTSDTDQTELAALMVGREVSLRVDKTRATPGEVLLSVDRLNVTDEQGVVRVREASFEVRAGEILGIAGVAGNGQSELLETLSGIRPVQQGQIRIAGAVFDAAHPIDPGRMRELGGAHVPEDRLRYGMVGSFRASESYILGYHASPEYRQGPFSNQGAIQSQCRGRMEDFDVRPVAPALGSASFSGGNQQKLVMARELTREPRILLIGQPTRGVDIGAIEFLHRRLIASRDAGQAIVLVSVELEEVMALSDRILVMFDGAISGEVLASETNEVELGLLMSGSTPDELAETVD